MKIKVVIADDHPIVRDGLRLTIESQAKDITIIGEAEKLCSSQFSRFNRGRHSGPPRQMVIGVRIAATNTMITVEKAERREKR